MPLEQEAPALPEMATSRGNKRVANIRRRVIDEAARQQHHVEATVEIQGFDIGKHPRRTLGYGSKHLRAVVHCGDPRTPLEQPSCQPSGSTTQLEDLRVYRK